MIFLETATRYSEFTVTGALSKYTDHKEDRAKLATGLSEPATPKK